MKHLGPVPGWHGYSPKNPPGWRKRANDRQRFGAMLERQALDIQERRRLKR